MISKAKCKSVFTVQCIILYMHHKVHILWPFVHVHLYICLSVTSWCSIKTVEGFIMKPVLDDNLQTLRCMMNHNY